jgi:hypothetical protein
MSRKLAIQMLDIVRQAEAYLAYALREGERAGWSDPEHYTALDYIMLYAPTWEN